MKTKGRAIIYELGGIYLLYLVYQMYQNRMASTGAEYGVVIAAIVLFLILGLGLLTVGFLIVHRAWKEEQNKQ